MSKKKSQNGFVSWVDERLPVFSYMQKEYGEYPMPRNANYFWSFGGVAMLILITMIITGIVLAMHYVPEENLAFERVEHIMRDVNSGWLIRYIHMNGASFFFIAIFIHMFRGMYYGSYKNPRELLWILGVVIFLLMMATAFIGYVLPWGQMSYAGATVITNLFSAIPLVGDSVVTWLWGGGSVSDPTLNRFFALHYLFPFLIFGVVLLHVIALHITGSNNPLGVELKKKSDSLPFHPYMTSKDTVAIIAFLIVFLSFVFFAPNYLGHPDNYVKANPLVTPEHIVPEWYFLPFYAILRAIPDKLGGVIAMFAAVFVLFVLPWLDTCKVKSAKFRPVFKWFFWLFVIDCFVLGYAGSKPADDELWLRVGQVGTLYYFAHFLVILPLLGKYEKTKAPPASISAAVLKSK